MPQLERCSAGGKIFYRLSHKFVPFRRTRFAYLNQQLDLKKKIIAPNWPTFLRVFSRSPRIKKKRSSSQHLQTAAQEKICTVMDSLGGQNFGGKRHPCPPPWLWPWVQILGRLIRTQCCQRLGIAATFFRKWLCCPGAMTRR